MARLPITVKGIRRLIDGMVDNSLEALKKFNNVATHENGPQSLEVGGPLEIAGTYAVGADGELGFFANVVTDLGDTEGAVTIDDDSGIGWNSEGNGTMRMTFVCKITANATRQA